MTKLTLGKLAKTDTKSNGTNYPVVASTSISQKIVHEFLVAKAKLDAVEGAVRTLKAQINDMVIKPFFANNNGKAEPVNGVVVEGSEDGEKVLVNFIKKYSATDEERVVEALGKTGKTIVKDYFYEKLSIKIDGDKIPAAKLQEVIDATVALYTKLGVLDAVDAKVVVVPNENFHAARHTILTEEQNITLQSVAPCQTQVKVYTK